MGMPVQVILPSAAANTTTFEAIFDELRRVDEIYSPFKPTSEVSKINRGLPEQEWDEEMKEIIELAQLTKTVTEGYFDIWHQGHFDPSGIVKGWAIDRAAAIARDHGHKDYYIEAGGDISLAGKNEHGDVWSIGIRNPFSHEEIVQVLRLTDCGIATSGTAARGQHIYNPHLDSPLHDILSLTVIGQTICDADRFATAAFAMGRPGITFIEGLDGYEGYMIDKDAVATMTSGFAALAEKI